MTTDPARSHLTRSDAYRLLAACFYEPEKKLFLEENLCSNLADLLGTLAMSGGDACRRMGQGLQQNDQTALLVDYSALFLGPFGTLTPPYGSVYLENERRLMGDSTLAVKRIYAEAGVKQESDGPPDHIAIELEFMSFLEQRISEAIAAGDQATADEFAAIETKFFFRYLAPWAPALASAIEKHAQQPFYRALGECLAGFIDAEKQRFKQTAGPAAP